MTSEVIIMNRNAMALAADSAVTVGNIKTYNGVNKLFYISNNPPIGIMIFGSADFENIPMETLIKEFKRKTDFNKIDDIESIKNEFLIYLAKNTPTTNMQKQIKNKLLLFDKIIKPTLENMDCESFEEFVISNGKTTLPDFINDIPEINDYEYDFADIIPDDIDESKHDILTKSLKNIFLDFLTSLNTGVVIAGFSEQDMFPSCIQFKMHFNYNGEIKISNYDSLINYEGNAVIPFAQKDVIKTFMTGIDDGMKNSIEFYFYQTILEYLIQLKKNISYNDEIDDKSLNAIEIEIDKFLNNCQSLSLDFMKNIENLEEKFSAPIVNSIGALPKNELGNMAESLIHATSLKRKVSNDLESVGGDIDVAIISKSDGFIWKKKKDYFKHDLNPQINEKT
ncbi:MAG: hypothetical protein E7Z76_06840 [Methanobrevibacter sp.]|nr:hypothetical protein [Methanobrevibacter sp.]